MCRASEVGAVLQAAKLPVIHKEVFDLIAQDCIPSGSRENLATANDFTEWHDVTEAQKILAADAQTSGGLLLCVPPRRLDAVKLVMKKYRASAFVIGQIVRSTKLKIIVQ